MNRMVDAYRYGKLRAEHFIGLSHSYFYYQPAPTGRSDKARQNPGDRLGPSALRIHELMRRECLTITVNHPLRGDGVVVTIKHIKSMHGLPKYIHVDNGREFISQDLDLWAFENDATLDFSRLGKPTDNPYIESFNGSFRDGMPESVMGVPGEIGTTSHNSCIYTEPQQTSVRRELLARSAKRLASVVDCVR